MTPPTDPPPPDRSKLFGRLIILGFGLLLLAYFIPLALNFLRPH